MRTQFGKRILESSVCVLCGEREATTKEHIPPQGLFDTKPTEYLSVPACEECNNSTKLEDEYLLQTMAGASLVGKGREIWNTKVSPKLKDRPKTKAGLRNQLSIRRWKVDQEPDLPLPVMFLDPKRIEKNSRKLVHGLYWFHTNTFLPQDNEIVVKFLNVIDGPKFFNSPEIMKISNKMSMGVYDNEEVMKTFFYTWLISDDLALFYFYFYKQNALIASTKLHV